MCVNALTRSHGNQASWRYKQVLPGTSSPEPQAGSARIATTTPPPFKTTQPPRFFSEGGRPAWVLAGPSRSSPGPPQGCKRQAPPVHPVQLPGRGASNRGLATRRLGFRACACTKYRSEVHTAFIIASRPADSSSLLPFLPQSNHNNTNPCKRFTSGISCHSLDRRVSPCQRSPFPSPVPFICQQTPALAHQGQHRCHWILLLLVRTPPRPLAVTQPLCQQNLHYGWPEHHRLLLACLLLACMPFPSCCVVPFYGGSRSLHAPAVFQGKVHILTRAASLAADLELLSISCNSGIRRKHGFFGDCCS